MRSECKMLKPSMKLASSWLELRLLSQLDFDLRKKKLRCGTSLSVKSNGWTMRDA